MLLHYAGEDFEDKRYTDFSLDGEWFKKDKVNLQRSLDFPGIPYYMDGTVKITQVIS